MADMTEVTITSSTGPDAPVTIPERPSNVPEKFWNAETGEINTEALLNSYGELEKKIGAPKSDDAPEGAAAKTEGEEGTSGGEGEGAGDEANPEADEALKVAEAAGLDVPALEAHWEEHGSLPDDAYEKLASVGVDKSLVDEFVAYRLAQGEALRKEMLGTVGGEEAVNKMVEWAAKNYSEEKARAFNDGVNSKDKGKIELALKALKADYDKANGVRPKLLNPAVEAAGRGDTYASFEEMQRDQANPLYRSDPAFRNRVIAKLARSNI